MAQTKEQKKKIIEDLKEKIKKQKIVIFVDFKGLKVSDLFELRKELRRVDSQLKVAKKTLISLAFGGYDPELSKIPIKLKRQVAVIFGFSEIISPAKTAWQFSLANPNLKILGGYFDKKYREAQEIITLAQLPSRDGLLTQLVRSISAPTSNLLLILEGNLKGLIFALSAIKNKK